MRYEDLKYLSFPLPEAIVKEKWSGHFDVVRQDINRLLSTMKIVVYIRIAQRAESNRNPAYMHIYCYMLLTLWIISSGFSSTSRL